MVKLPFFGVHSTGSGMMTMGWDLWQLHANSVQHAMTRKVLKDFITMFIKGCEDTKIDKWRLKTISF